MHPPHASAACIRRMHPPHASAACIRRMHPPHASAHRTRVKRICGRLSSFACGFQLRPAASSECERLGLGRISAVGYNPAVQGLPLCVVFEEKGEERLSTLSTTLVPFTVG